MAAVFATLGIRIPLLVARTSNAALGSAVKSGQLMQAASCSMAMFWAFIVVKKQKKSRERGME